MIKNKLAIAIALGLISCTSSLPNIVHANAAITDSTNDTSFLLRDVIVDTDLTLSDNKDLREKVLKKYIGKRVTMTDLQALRTDLTKFYQHEGYIASEAYLPTQTMSNGIVHYHFAKGVYGNIRINNLSTLTDSTVAEKFKRIKTGSVVEMENLEDALSSVNDINGISASASLSRDGDRINLDVDIHNSSKSQVMIYADNHGSKDCGRNRLGASVHLYDIGKKQIEATAIGSVSNNHTQDYYFDLAVPTKPSRQNNRISFSIERSHYSLGGEWKDLNLNGESTTYELMDKINFLSSNKQSYRLQTGFRHKEIRDSIGSFLLDTKKHSNSFYTEWESNKRYENNMLNYSVALTAGNLNNISEYARYLDQFSHTDGIFYKLELKSDYMSSIKKWPNWMLKNHSEIQLANKNLDSSEKMTLGGPNAVRAYPVGENSSDVGLLNSLELVYTFPKAPSLSLSAFLDCAVGKPMKSNDEWIPMGGGGIGLSYEHDNDFFLRLYHARRIGWDNHLSEDSKSLGQTWLLAGFVF